MLFTLSTDGTVLEDAGPRCMSLLKLSGSMAPPIFLVVGIAFTPLKKDGALGSCGSGSRTRKSKQRSGSEIPFVLSP